MTSESEAAPVVGAGVRRPGLDGVSDAARPPTSPAQDRTVVVTQGDSSVPNDDELLPWQRYVATRIIGAFEHGEWRITLVMP